MHGKTPDPQHALLLLLRLPLHHVLHGLLYVPGRPEAAVCCSTQYCKPPHVNRNQHSTPCAWQRLLYCCRGKFPVICLAETQDSQRTEISIAGTAIAPSPPVSSSVMA